MENLIFSLNAAVPIFLMMMLGLLFHKIGWIDDAFASKMNKFVFRVPLPVLLFYNMATEDFSRVWDTGFVVFCFFATLAGIALAALLSGLLRDRILRGEFIQGSYRSSAALLGIALVQNIYGKAEIAPLMIVASVPLYNVVAVLVLTLFQPNAAEAGSGIAGSTDPGQAAQGGNAVVCESAEQSGIRQERSVRRAASATEKSAAAGKNALLLRTLRGIATNPIIIGILTGCIWSLLRLPLPAILDKTVSSVAATATPLGLMAMGATFDFRKAFAKLGPAVFAAAIKLVGLCALFLPLAVFCGFRGEKLISILVMLGSATTVSCFVMAKNMGHEGTLSSSIVMLTTLFSAFTLTGWLFVLKSLGLI